MDKVVDRRVLSLTVELVNWLETVNIHHISTSVYSITCAPIHLPMLVTALQRLLSQLQR